MRNFWKYIIPVFIVILVVGGIVLSVNLNIKETAHYATNLEYKYTNLTLYKNVTYTLTKNEFLISPTNCNQKIVLTTTDTNIIEIDSTTGEIFAKEVGNATIIAKIKSSATENIQTTINVIVKNQNEANITSTREVEITHSVSESLFINFNNYFDGPTTSREILEGNEIIEPECKRHQRHEET